MLWCRSEWKEEEKEKSLFTLVHVKGEIYSSHEYCTSKREKIFVDSNRMNVGK